MMKPKRMLPVIVIVIVIVAMLLFIGVAIWRFAPQPDEAAHIVDVTLPDTLGATAQIGHTAYQSYCATCHGVNAAGRVDLAPPLVHVLYEPGHHGDDSFYRAAETGVRAHHWPFGDMPAVEGITRGEVTTIIAYIRELQRANAIH